MVGNQIGTMRKYLIFAITSCLSLHGFEGKNITYHNAYPFTDALLKNENSTPQAYCGSTREGLSGRVLKVAALEDLPYFGLSFRDGYWVPNSGIDLSILRTLGEALNFSFQVASPEDGEWGIVMPNGTITGMIGMVARGEADLAVSEITISGQRDTVVDFTVQYYMESSVLVSRAAKPASKAMAVFAPFSMRIWILLLLCVCFYGTLLWIARQYVPSPNKEGGNPSLFITTLQTFQSMTLQGVPLRVQSWVLRFLFIGWFFFSLLICALYAGTLTAVLTSPTYEKQIDSLEDLVKNKLTTPIIFKGTSLHQLLATATSGIYKQVYDRLDPRESYTDDADEAIQKVLNKGFVSLEAKLTSEMRAAVLNRNKFHFSKQSFYPQSYAVACGKDSDLVHIFNQYLSRFIEMGLILKWRDDELRKATSNSTEKGTNQKWHPTALRLHQLQGAFVLYVIGIAAATAVALAEIFCSVRNLRKLTVNRRPNNSDWIDNTEIA